MTSIGIPALILAVLVGLALRYWARHHGKGRLRNVLKRYRPYAPGASGLVSISGEAHGAGKLLESPISRAPVLGYQLLVVQRRYDRRGNFYWRVVHEESSFADFVIEHEGDPVEVADHEKLGVLLVPDAVDLKEHDAEAAIPFRFRERLDEKAVKLQDDYYGELKVITGELLAKNGSKVTLLGHVEQLPDAGGDFAGYREANTRPRMVPPPDEPYLVTTVSAEHLAERIGELDPDALREMYLDRALARKRA